MFEMKSSLELSFNGGKPSSGIFGPKFSEAEANADRRFLVGHFEE